MKTTYNNLRILLVLSAVCLIGCKNNDTVSDVSFEIDVATAIDRRQHFDLYDIADTIEYICLDDSSKDALLGDITAIQESKKGFYILNTLYEPIKVFDQTGKYISTKGNIGRGSDEFFALEGMAVDPVMDNTYLLTISGSVLAYDDTGGVFARNDSVPDGEPVYFKDQLILLRSSFSAISPDSLGNVPFLEVFSPNLHHEKSIATSNKGKHLIMVDDETGRYVWLVGQFISGNGNSLLVKEARSDIVYQYNSDATLEPVYKLEMGMYAYPPEMFEDFHRPEQLERYYVVKNMYDADRYIFAGVNNGPYILSYLVFDKRNFSDGFMAVGTDGEAGLFAGGVKFNPCYVRDNRLVGYMQAFDIVDNADAITDPPLKALAATLREDSNPVLVVAELKK